MSHVPAPKRRRRRPRRGYPVALLVSLAETRATARAAVWMVYSESIAPVRVVVQGPSGSAGTSNPRFAFYDQLMATIKPSLATGVHSVVIAAKHRPGKGGATIANGFMDHLQKHHAYLFKKGENQLHASIVSGEAMDAEAAIRFARSSVFAAITTGTVDKETTGIIELLDASINNPHRAAELLYTLDEIDTIFAALREEENPVVPEFVIMTDVFWASHKGDPRLQRVMALAKRTRTRTRVIQASSEAGERVTALGGLVCIASPPGEDIDGEGTP